jgi:hypothetical protein
VSESAVIDQPETFTAAVVPLLKEYTAKFQDWFQQMETAFKSGLSVPPKIGAALRVDRSQAQLDTLVEVWNRARPPAYELARQVSGMIEQGPISPLERVELRLRLAEFEGVLIGIEQLIDKRKGK